MVVEKTTNGNNFEEAVPQHGFYVFQRTVYIVIQRRLQQHKNLESKETAESLQVVNAFIALPTKRDRKLSSNGIKPCLLSFQ